MALSNNRNAKSLHSLASATITNFPLTTFLDAHNQYKTAEKLTSL